MSLNRLNIRQTLGFALGLLLILGGALLYWLTYAPNTRIYEGQRAVQIPPGADFTQIVDSLKSAGVLRSRLSFKTLAAATGWYQQVKPGLYRFSANASNMNMLGRLRRGEQDPVRVMIPPGTRPGVVAKIIGRDLYTDSTTFRAALGDSSLAAELQTDTRHLFGYVLPNTYQFYWLTESDEVLRRLKETFDRSFTQEMQQKADSLGLTKEEVIRLASIVEWEARKANEKARIAGVYLNRLRINMPLQADPTIQYAVMEQNGGQKRRLLYEDYEIDHSYNTYNYQGLPPGPITNPALSTVEAVLNAEDHNYRFFVANGNGGHTFSRTFAEHQRAAAKYRRLMRERRRAQK